MRDMSGVNPDGRKDGEKLGGAQEGENVIRIYYKRK